MTRRLATLQACMRDIDSILTSQGVKPNYIERARIIRALRPCIQKIQHDERERREIKALLLTVFVIFLAIVASDYGDPAVASDVADPSDAPPSLSFATHSEGGVGASEGDHFLDPKDMVEDELRNLVRNCADFYGLDWGADEIDAMVEIAWRESRFDPSAQHEVSSAYGLWQFLDATWKGTGFDKSKYPSAQTLAAVRYVADRYKTPTRALAFHDEHGWY